MFRLANPDYIYAFLLVPILYVLYFLYRRWKKSKIETFGESRLVRRLNPEASISRPSIRFFLLLVSVVLIIAAVCGPLIGSKLEEIKRKGADIIIAVDVSNSMLAEDIKPSRLERTRQAISRLIDNLEGDRIGIIVLLAMRIRNCQLLQIMARQSCFFQHLKQIWFHSKELLLALQLI